MKDLMAHGSLAGILTITFAALNGCGEVAFDHQDVAEVSTETQPLFVVVSNVWKGEIPVCWEDFDDPGSDAASRQTVRNAVETTWEAHSSVRFTGWGQCPAYVLPGGGSQYWLWPGFRIRVIDNLQGTYFGRTNFLGEEKGPDGIGRQMILNFGLCNWSEDCLHFTAVHEFGHALGFPHEQDRPDTPEWCREANPLVHQFSEKEIVETVGDWDGDSVMNYCSKNMWMGVLSEGDIFGLQKYYGGVLGGSMWTADGGGWCYTAGAELHTGDFNGDGRTDLLCHNTSTGENAIDYADASGHFGGSDWTQDFDWCTHDGARLYLGDFNGDGRDDMLCHDDEGGMWIDLATAAGTFVNGSDWQHDIGWCSHPGAQLYVGDFNGDGRDDLLCHDEQGRRWIDLADKNGSFYGSDFVADALEEGWCWGSGELHVGDFNADGTDDILCHDPGSGDEWIDYGTIWGEFWGTNWTRDFGWCGQGRVLVGDITGDYLDDLVCDNRANKDRVEFDYADAYGHFKGSDYAKQVTSWWCPVTDDIVLGDFDGNGHTDWLCHSMQTGRRAIAFSTLSN